MKPDPNGEAVRWLKQAEHAFDVTRMLLQKAYFSDTCFNAEQTGQLALKAFLYHQGERFVTIHSVKALAERCVTYDGEFQALVEAGQTLDRYYIPTRYPDAWASPTVPYENYTEQEAREALAAASAIVTLVKQKIGSPS